MNDKLDMQVASTIEDMDGDGEDEVVFTPMPQKSWPAPPALTSPLLLKGISTLKPFSPRK